MALIAIPRSANSGARFSAIAETAALLAAYSVWLWTAMRALIEASKDRPPALHRRHRCLGGEQLTRHIDTKNAIEVGFGDRLKAPKCSTPALLARCPARHKLIDYPRHHIRGLGAVGDISAKCRGLVALVGQARAPARRQKTC